MIGGMVLPNLSTKIDWMIDLVNVVNSKTNTLALLEQIKTASAALETQEAAIKAAQDKLAQDTAALAIKQKDMTSALHSVSADKASFDARNTDLVAKEADFAKAKIALNTATRAFENEKQEFLLKQTTAKNEMQAAIADQASAISKKQAALADKEKSLSDREAVVKSREDIAEEVIKEYAAKLTALKKITG